MAAQVKARRGKAKGESFALAGIRGRLTKKFDFRRQWFLMRGLIF